MIYRDEPTGVFLTQDEYKLVRAAYKSKWSWRARQDRVSALILPIAIAGGLEPLTYTHRYHPDFYYAEKKAEIIRVVYDDCTEPGCAKED